MGKSNNTTIRKNERKELPERPKIMPVEVTGLDVAFGGDMKKLLPKRAEIPEEFFHGTNELRRLAQRLFYRGGRIELKAREGIDRGKALNHLRAVLGSFEPEHRHKISGVAYLISLWFE